MVVFVYAQTRENLIQLLRVIQFSLPSIEELLIKVHNDKLFSCLDLKSGYHQVSLDPETKEKTSFCVNDRLYEHTRLPFGLRNAPSHFSCLMTSFLSNLIGRLLL